MLFRLKQVRRSSKFQSRLRSASRHRQEYAASLATTGAIQAGLAIALFIAAIRSFQALNARAEDASVLLRLVLPVSFSLAGLWCVRLALGRFRGARNVWTQSRPPQPPPK